MIICTSTFPPSAIDTKVIFFPVNSAILDVLILRIDICVREMKVGWGWGMKRILRAVEMLRKEGRPPSNLESLTI